MAGRPQLVTEGDWLLRLGSSRRVAGTGMDDAAVCAFSVGVDIPALRAC